jgi:UPF0755 protein
MMRFVKVFAILALIISAISAFGYVAFLMPTETFPTLKTVTVENGASFHQVARRLKAAGVIRSEYALILLAELSGQARKIKPGDYDFAGGESLRAILDGLTSGAYAAVTVTIPEGLTVRQIAQKFEQAGLTCQSDFELAAGYGPLIRAVGLGPMGAEGFLFPATYRVPRHADAPEIVATMLMRFYENLTPMVEQRMFAVGLDARQVVTLASIIEKEAKVPGERPLIASVFFNRLRLGIPLQSDPTAQYNLEGVSQPASLAVHMRSQFNTYDFAGLPPGPIANPGASSINAALYPASTDYLYFVARGDGTHIFSRTLKEHEHAIAALREHRTPIEDSPPNSPVGAD